MSVNEKEDVDMVFVNESSNKEMFVRVESAYIEVRDSQVVQFIRCSRVCECVRVEGI